MNRKIGYVLIIVMALTIVTCLGAAYAYQATYTEDPTQGADVTPKYISVTGNVRQAMPTGVSFSFSTMNQTAGTDDIVIDTEQPIAVLAAGGEEIEFTQSGTEWIASDDSSKRKYTLDLSSDDPQAEAVFLLGSYTVVHNGSDLAVTITPSKATGEDSGNIVSLKLSSSEDYGGSDSVMVSTGSVVYLYAHVDVSKAFSTEEYGTIQIPSVTPTLTAVPAEI